jgi:HEAT repeat protein
MKFNLYFYLAIICFVMLANVSCTAISATPRIEPSSIPPTAPSTLFELLDVLSNGSAEARISAALKVLTLSENEKELAIPSLVKNLDYDNSDVRRATAIVLGEIGPTANQSVEGLISLLTKDDSTRVRIAAAEALGKLDDRSIVPVLADQLDSSNTELAIVAAKSLALLTGKNFSDVDSQNGYSLDQGGNPYIVIDAKAWWESEGKFLEWRK